MFLQTALSIFVRSRFGQAAVRLNAVPVLLLSEDTSKYVLLCGSRAAAQLTDQEKITDGWALVMRQNRRAGYNHVRAVGVSFVDPAVVQFLAGDTSVPCSLANELS